MFCGEKGISRAQVPLPFWQYMLHDQREEIFSSNGSGLIALGFGVHISECDHAVFDFPGSGFLVNVGSGHYHG